MEYWFVMVRKSHSVGFSIFMNNSWGGRPMCSTNAWDMIRLLEYLKSNQIGKRLLTIRPRDNLPNHSLRWRIVGSKRHLDRWYRGYHSKIREIVGRRQSLWYSFKAN
jgi:hypothetical protein